MTNISKNPSLSIKRFCIDCDEPLTTQRLVANPNARLCCPCQQAVETEFDWKNVSAESYIHYKGYVGIADSSISTEDMTGFVPSAELEELITKYNFRKKTSYINPSRVESFLRELIGKKIILVNIVESLDCFTFSFKTNS